MNYIINNKLKGATYEFFTEVKIRPKERCSKVLRNGGILPRIYIVSQSTRSLLKYITNSKLQGGDI